MIEIEQKLIFRASHMVEYGHGHCYRVNFANSVICIRYRDMQTEHVLVAMQQNLSLGFLTRSDTNRPQRLQEKARSLKFQI